MGYDVCISVTLSFIIINRLTSSDRYLHLPAHPTSLLWTSDLEYVDNYKYLGVWLDCKVSFQTYIKHLHSKVKSRIGFLFRNRASFTHAAKHILPTKHTKHAANCFVTKAPYTTHHCDLYTLVGWPSLHTRRQTHWL